MIIIDRFEGSFAVCFDSGRQLDIPISDIEGSPTEGDVIISCGGVYRTDKAAAEQRRKIIIEKENGLWE